MLGLHSKYPNIQPSIHLDFIEALQSLSEGGLSEYQRFKRFADKSNTSVKKIP
ncbi:MAG: hypothetical protein ACI9JN_000862 [Bacteroidia bacterium]|jgi:hypothetical protein